MRAVIIDPDVSNRYRVVERVAANPGPGEVLIDMRAVSLNFRDALIRAHPVMPQYGGDARGRIPTSDGVGSVAALGEGVASLAVGDRVIPSFFPHWLSGPPTADKVREHLGATVDGVLAQQVVMPAHALVRAPTHLAILRRLRFHVLL
jgi:NADPH:quinone reductase-like Zn-dependent oxidoreductase